MRAGVLRALRGLHDRGRTPALILAYHRIAASSAARRTPSISDSSARRRKSSMRRCARCVNTRIRSRSIRSPTPSCTDRTLPRTRGRGHVRRRLQRHVRSGVSRCCAVTRFPPPFSSPRVTSTANEPFWFELTAHLMLRIPPRSIVAGGCARRFARRPTTTPARRESIAILHRLLKACDNSRRRELVEEWRRRFAALIDARAIELRRSIARPQIWRWLATASSFGSHTISHPNLVPRLGRRHRTRAA